MIFFLYILLTILLNTKSTENAKLIEFKSSECLDENIWNKKYINRILNQSNENGFQTYNIFVVTNCSLASQGEIKIKDDTLNLIYKGKIIRKTDTLSHIIKDSIEEIVTIEEEIETISSCDCAFELKYKIKGLKNKKYIILANNKPISQTKHKFEIKHNKPTYNIIDKDTFNFIDIYGHKQGLQIISKDENHSYIVKFKDNDKVSGIYTKYNFRGYEKIEFLEKYGIDTKMKFYKNGRIFKECDSNGGFYEEGTNCIYTRQ